MFNNLGFRSFINILSYNCERVERFGEVLQGYLDVLWASRQTLPTTQAMIDAEIDDNILIEKMTKAAIEEIGKLSIALNYDSNVKKILVDKRLVFMVSYEEFQRQFLRSPKLIKMELEGRMNTSVCIKELNVNAAIKNKVNEDDIWENLDALRLWLELNASDDLYNKIMDSRYNYCNDPHINEIHEMRRQTHLMAYLKNLKKYGITNEMALKILAFSKSKRKINKYKRLYYVIVSNEMLERLEKEDAKDAILYNKKLKDKMQVAIYCYIKKKNQQTFTQSKTLNSEIILYYHTQFPNEKKKITDRKMTNTINNMYKSSGQKRKGELRTCEKDIFKVIESDYK
jgi:hypothetical protein